VRFALAAVRRKHTTTALCLQSSVSLGLGLVLWVKLRRCAGAYFLLEWLKEGNVHMCFSSHSGYRPFITPTPCPRKLTFRYNCMLNFIQVSFCFLLFLRLGLGWFIIRLWLRLGFGFDNLKKYFKIFDRLRCKHIGHSLSLDACFSTDPPLPWLQVMYKNWSGQLGCITNNVKKTKITPEVRKPV